MIRLKDIIVGALLKRLAPEEAVSVVEPIGTGALTVNPRSC